MGLTKKQIDEFCEYLLDQVAHKSIYVWSCNGENLYEMSLGKIAKMETSQSNFNRVINLVNNNLQRGYNLELAKCFDCSGLGTYKLLQMKVISSDMTADGLYRKCKEKSIKDIKKGDFVFKLNSNGRCTHIGYVVDNDFGIVEAYGRDKGVVYNILNKGSSNFTKAGTLK